MWLLVQWVILTALSVALLSAIYRIVIRRDSPQGERARVDELNPIERQTSDRHDLFGTENIDKKDSGESSI